MKRRQVYESIFSARALFITGFLIMPALLFNPSTEYRFILFLFFWFLTWLCDKNSNFLFTVLFFVFIIAFNLFIPYGRIIFSIGSFRITSGALLAGIHRSVTLQALVMLSKVTIRQDLKIPGVLGEILSESLRMFSVIINKKIPNPLRSKKDIIVEIDKLMIELSREEHFQAPVIKQRTKPLGYVILIAVILISWLPYGIFYL